MSTLEETRKRIEIAEKEITRFEDVSLGAIIAGSVAYAPNLHVTQESDVDIVIVIEDIKEVIDRVVDNVQEREGLKKRFFEGYCVKRKVEGVPVSTHLLSADSFDIISKCYVADMRVYRQDPKPGQYRLMGFDGRHYDYRIKNVDLEELPGVRTIVPISFIAEDRYFLGIHRDKLLSQPKIISGNKYVSRHIDKLWQVVCANLYYEALRLDRFLDLEKINILNALAKKDKMSPDAIESIKDKTRFYISQVR